MRRRRPHHQGRDFEAPARRWRKHEDGLAKKASRQPQNKGGVIDLVCGHRTANVQYANRGVVGLCPVCHSYQLTTRARGAGQEVREFLDAPYREDRSDEEIAADFKARRGAEVDDA